MFEMKKELEQNFTDYCYAVNIDRAIPDAKTGLKPVHQRILYGAYDLKVFSSKPFVKSARVVGHVMGQLHPHGRV